MRLELPNFRPPGAPRITIHQSARLTPVRRAEMASAVLAAQSHPDPDHRGAGGAPHDATPPEHVRAAHCRADWGVAHHGQQGSATRQAVAAARPRPSEPVVRYHYREPGGLIHLDIKKLGRFERVRQRIKGDRTGQSYGRGVGWEQASVCIDGASRIAATGICLDEKAYSAISALRAAVAYDHSLGIRVTRVMTGSGQSENLRGRLLGPGPQTYPGHTRHAQDSRPPGKNGSVRAPMTDPGNAIPTCRNAPKCPIGIARTAA